MHPLALALILHNALVPQLTKVARDPGLRQIQRLHQLADTEPPLLLHKQQAVESGCVRKRTEELFGSQHIRISIYIECS